MSRSSNRMSFQEQPLPINQGGFSPPLGNMEAFIGYQEKLYHKILRGIEALEERGNEYMTSGAIKTQREAVQDYWLEYRERHYAMMRSPQVDLENEYYRSNILDDVESTYLQTMGRLQDLLDRLSVPFSPLRRSTPLSHDHLRYEDDLRLEKITISPFSGKDDEWIAFKSLFKELVIGKDNMSNIAKFQYLRSKVQGKALDLIKHIEFKSENFEVAWNKLETFYENKRRLVNSLLTSLLSIKPITSETSAEANRLLEGTLGPLASLKALGRPIDTWDDILVFLTFSKLSINLKKDWENHLGHSVTPPTFKELSEFLAAKINNLKNLEDSTYTRFAQPAPSAPANKVTGKSAPYESKSHQVVESGKSAAEQVTEKCLYCKKSHRLYECESFKPLSVNEKYVFANAKGLCYNCLRGTHRRFKCKSRFRCSTCNKKHHSILHTDDPTGISHLITQCSSERGSSESEDEPDGQEVESAASSALLITTPNEASVHYDQCKGTGPSTNLLATALVQVENESGERLLVRALVDPCSQASFLSSKVYQSLRLPSKECKLRVEGMNDSELATCKTSTSFILRPHFESKYSCKVNAYVSKRISNYNPASVECVSTWPHLKGLQLADPRYTEIGTIDLLLGVNVYSRIIQEGLRKGEADQPIALNTQLGWLISGCTNEEQVNEEIVLAAFHCNAQPDLVELLSRFWAHEELNDKRPESPSDIACENIFTKTVSRNEQGRYIVTLPFRVERLPPLEKTREAALRLLQHMEKRFLKDPKFKGMYHAFIQDYVECGHMTLIGALEEADFSRYKAHCFLPHHGILKESSSTTKLRTVFNGSSKIPSGISLNDCLYTGKNLLPSLAALLINWRKYRFAFTADIKQMFRQILVDEKSQAFQLILWRFEPTQPVDVYALKTVTYGLASSPFLANRTIKQLAQDEQKVFPLGASTLASEIYMDDVLSGAHTVEAAQQKLHEVRGICKVGGFELRKWLANEISILEKLPSEVLAADSNILFKEDTRFAILGISWQPNLDQFQYTVSANETSKVWTKRMVASKIAQLFDPLGLLGPIIITARIILQELWRRKLDWDKNLPYEIAKEWIGWYSTLPEISGIKIPRWIGYTTEYNSVQIHGFSDASLKAYGAVVYLRVDTAAGIRSQIVTARSKVAPLKVQSVPKLELLAARLLAEVVSSIVPMFDEGHVEVTLWTDSMDVLHWLDKHPSEWETFVATKCARIMELIPESHWKHVPTQSNPADLVSRGVLPSELSSLELWWEGPGWLKRPQGEWEKPLLEVDITPDKLACHQIVEKNVQAPQEKNTDFDCEFYELLKRKSSLQQLLRITSYVLRFIDVIAAKWSKKERLQRKVLGQQWYTPEETTSVVVTPKEMHRAQLVWVYITQRRHYPRVFKDLLRDEQTPHRSLAKFCPVEHKGILIVGGRLKHSLLMPEQQHPIILPPDSPLSRLIVLECHLKTLHGGTQLTLATVRLNYWILRGRQLVKRIIKECLSCIRYRAVQSSQLMGNLPLDRVRPDRPFRNSGVDYAGPYRVKVAPGRCRTTYKCYICIFVCLSTKAVSLELVAGYDTDAFIAAFRRFTARRGHCALLRSDQGTNLVGADAELRKMYTAGSDYAKKLEVVAANEKTKWKFNPPGAPNFGGIWEAAVKSAKHHIKRVIGDNKLTYEEFITFLYQVEACLNSRPLLALTDDPSDLKPLTPAHFTILTDSYIVPEENLLEKKIPAGRRWAHIQQMLQQVWSYWSRDYLQSLQARGKWQKKQRPMRVGDVVLVRDETTLPAQWPVALITEVFPGDDGLPRVANIRVRNTEKAKKFTILKRPVTKLILMIPASD